MTIVQKLYFPCPVLLSAGLVFNARLETGAVRETVDTYDTVTFVPKPNTRTQSLVTRPNIPDVTRRVTFGQVPQADPNTALVLHGTVHSLAIGARISRQTLGRMQADSNAFIRISPYEPFVLLNNIWFSGEIWLVAGPDLPFCRMAMRLNSDTLQPWFHGQNAAVIPVEPHVVAYPYSDVKHQLVTKVRAGLSPLVAPSASWQLVDVAAPGASTAIPYYSTVVHAYHWTSAAGWALSPLPGADEQWSQYRLIDGYTAPSYTDPEWADLHILSVGLMPRSTTAGFPTCLMRPAAALDMSIGEGITCDTVLAESFRMFDVMPLYESTGAAVPLSQIINSLTLQELTQQP